MLLWLCGNKEKPKEQILLFFFFEFSFSSNQTLWEYKKKRKVEKIKNTVIRSAYVNILPHFSYTSDNILRNG